MRILVVDDSRAMRTIVRRTLRQAGFGEHAVAEAENGLHALEEIEKEKPDLILSDWNMPEMNGIELLRTIGEKQIPVHLGFVTSERTDEMWVIAREAGALFLITKPFSADRFREALEPVLDYLAQVKNA